MAIWRITSKRNISNIIKAGTSITISTTGNAKPQWHQVKKELNISSGVSPSMTDSNWIFERLD